MIKASCNLLPKRVREIENVLFEMSPTNWVIITNRNTKASTLEGTFDDETSAYEQIEFLNKAFGETFKFSIEKEFKSGWKEAYKHHFQAWNYKMFHFVPTWERQTTQITTGSKAIYIDPGMAFGTGTHETTRLCIELLIDNYLTKQPNRKKENLIDIGCGSGILAITAAKLGFEEILAVDNDINAIENAKLNSKFNVVSNCISFKECDIKDVSHNQYQCVISNIQADVLLLNASLMIDMMKTKECCLILSGILDYETAHVIKAYKKLFDEKSIDFDLQEKNLGEWSALSFQI